jgi:hypothetical protein
LPENEVKSKIALFGLRGAGNAERSNSDFPKDVIRARVMLTRALFISANPVAGVAGEPVAKGFAAPLARV